MKNSKLVIVAVASAFSLSLGVKSVCAQDYPAQVNLVRITTNSSGGLVYHKYRNGDIIRACAHETGLTNLTGLSLVYNRTADALQVVMGTNQALVCAPLSFAGGTWLSNTNHTKAERLAWVYVDSSSMANGTLAATERFTYSPSNVLTSFSLSGQLQFTVGASGTNSPAIYKGRLVAGSDLDDRDEEDEDSRQR